MYYHYTKAKRNKSDCAFLLNVVGKLYGEVLVKTNREDTEGMICDEQGEFRRGRGCVDQIFAVKQVCGKY